EIESKAPTQGTLEEISVGFSYYRPFFIAKGWWNTKRTYTVTQVGPFKSCYGLGGDGECRVMECLSEKRYWFAGAGYRHSWNVRSQMSPEDLDNVSCHEVDPSALKSDRYDDMGRRVEYGAAS